MKKVFGIYFSEDKALAYPFNKKVFFESYGEIIDVLQKYGIQTVIVRGNSYKGKGLFSHYYIWTGKTYEKVDKDITVSLLWNRDSENTIPYITDMQVLNSFEFDEICRDKEKTAIEFSEFGPKTFLIDSYEDFKTHFSSMKTELIVLKPRFGEQCRGVEILPKQKITEKTLDSWKDIIMQEFLDSSIGIPGLIEGLHELNIFFVNGEFSGARYKIPPAGSLITSATGCSIGIVQGLHKEEVPIELLQTIKKLDSQLERYPVRLYRADFVNTKHGYKLIELNSRPGLMHPDKEGKEFYWEFNGKIVEMVKTYFGK